MRLCEILTPFKNRIKKKTNLTRQIVFVIGIASYQLVRRWKSNFRAQRSKRSVPNSRGNLAVNYHEERLGLEYARFFIELFIILHVSAHAVDKTQDLFRIQFALGINKKTTLI